MTAGSGRFDKNKPGVGHFQTPYEAYRRQWKGDL